MPLEDKIEIELSTPIRNVDVPGERITCKKVVLYAPIMLEDSDSIIEIKKLFHQGFLVYMATMAPIGLANQEAISKRAEKLQESKEAKDEGANPALVMSQLYLSPDPKAAITAFVSLFEAGRAKLDGKITINNSLWGQISSPDQDKIMGEYLANFMLPAS